MSHRHTRTCCAWVVLCAASMLAGGRALAGGWAVRAWQTDEGLPDNRIAGVIQADDGYLWVATLGGLVRFDGARFEELQTFALTKQPNQNVRGLLQDRRGKIWLALDLNTTARVEGEHFTVFNTGAGMANSAVRAMAEDGEGGIWLARRNAVLRIAGDKVEAFGERDGLPQEGYAWVAADKRGTLWYACGRTVGVFRRGRFEPLLTMAASTLSLAPSRDGDMWIISPSRLSKVSAAGVLREVARLPTRITVRAALEDRGGALWIGTLSAGLLRWDGQAVEPIGLPRTQITALAEDCEGNLWAGTDGGGLCRLRPRVAAVVGAEAGLPAEAVQTVCEDADGRTWAVLQYGNLACRDRVRWKVLTAADGWPGGVAVCVAPAVGGGVWVGMGDSGLLRWREGRGEVWGPANGFDLRSIRSLLAAADGAVWIVTDWPNRLRVLKDGALSEVAAPPNMQAMIALAETPDGRIWAGASNGRLFEVRDMRLVRVESAAPAYPSYVRSLHAAKDGRLWVGYGGSGLGCLHDGRFAALSEEQGLFDSRVSQVLSDDSGRLWMTGSRGLFCAKVAELARVLDGETNRVRCIGFGPGEGLSNLQPMWQFNPTAWRTASGGLLFAVGNGLLDVCPGAALENPVAPAVVIERVRLDDRLLAKRDSRSALAQPEERGVLDLSGRARPRALPPRHGTIEFEFTALSFSSPENVHFRYRLDGFDDAWVEAGRQRSARYPRLAAGKYEFCVIACNETGLWGAEGARFAFTVRPFFWQTWWFRALTWLAAAAFLTGATVAVLRRRHRLALGALERQRAIEQERTRIAQDMHDQLGSGLTKANMVSEALRREAGVSGPLFQMLRETLERLTVTMDELVWAVNPQHDTLDGLANYVIRYAQEYLAGTDIACALDVPADLPAVAVAAPVRHNLFLAFEEALSNAVRHAGAREVKVRMAFCGGAVTLEVSDNGRGFALEEARAGAHGLENMRRRMAAVGGACEIRSAESLGTCVSFVLALGPGGRKNDESERQSER